MSWSWSPGPPAGVVTLDDIRGSQSYHGTPELGPMIASSPDHVVLFRLSTTSNNGAPPAPFTGKDQWDDNHVRMPCSPLSKQEVTVARFKVKEVARWEIIEKALRKDITNSNDLKNAILKYNPKFKDNWHFGAFHKFFDQYLPPLESKRFFKDILPKMVTLALDLPKFVQTAIPFLKKNKTMSISLSQLQIASLLANAFFCTFPWRNSGGGKAARYPKINFSTLYEGSEADGVLQKLACICNYFSRVCTAVPTGVVTFTRRCVSQYECPDWTNSAVPIHTLPVYISSDLAIEDADGLIQVDFANKFLGGGVLGRGLVQEEIRFLICPEMIVSMLFTEELEPNEAFVMIGCERYNNSTGYGRERFRFNGDYRDNTPRDSYGRRRCVVVAIDAIPFQYYSEQFQKHKIIRELNKAWIGFSFSTNPRSNNYDLEYPGVATGNWGCGAFKGSPHLKALLQLMACAQARRPVAYCTYHDPKLKEELIAALYILTKHHVTVGQLYQMVLSYNTSTQMDLYKYLNYQLEYVRPSRHMTALPPPARPSRSKERLQMGSDPNLSNPGTRRDHSRTRHLSSGTMDTSPSRHQNFNYLGSQPDLSRIGNTSPGRTANKSPSRFTTTEHDMHCLPSSSGATATSTRPDQTYANVAASSTSNIGRVARTRQLYESTFTANQFSGNGVSQYTPEKAANSRHLTQGNPHLTTDTQSEGQCYKPKEPCSDILTSDDGNLINLSSNSESDSSEVRRSQGETSVLEDFDPLTLAMQTYIN